MCVSLYVCDLLSVCVLVRDTKIQTVQKCGLMDFQMAAGLIRGHIMQRERERVCCVCERYKNKDCPKFCLMDFQMAACLIRGPTMQRESECVVCV